METTIDLDDRLFAEAKSYAEQSARSLSQVVEEALREKLKNTSASAPKPKPSVSAAIHPDVQRITGLASTEENAKATYLSHL
ncbi:MAG TPA: DUF6364 family protein, partial [Candidatus Acidoferrum sp.]|nr:DUF6364 family protein [Candidatus Acidoferrum sp.]